MKRSKLLYLLGTLVVLAMLSISCTKEGPAGPAGANGTNGEDGIDGQDGTATCIQCHDDSQVMFAKSMQWENSVHAQGGTFARNGTSCAPCHVSQGFLERMASGEQTTSDAILNPNPVNCYTCHNVHATYTPDDWALTYAEPVYFWFLGNNTGPEYYDWNKGNLCANCHQSRIASPFPTVGSSETYTITSYRYGPHHGPQSNLLAGISGYEVAGSMNYTNAMHTNIENGCVTCHMADAPGIDMGGHAMNVGIDGSINDSGCLECHPDGIDDATEALQEEIHMLLEELHNLLIAQSISDSAGYLLGDDGENRASSSNPANLTATEAGTFFNFKFIEEDRSGGVHNWKYAKALLTNSIEAIQ